MSKIDDWLLKYPCGPGDHAVAAGTAGRKQETAVGDFLEAGPTAPGNWA